MPARGATLRSTRLAAAPTTIWRCSQPPRQVCSALSTGVMSDITASPRNSSVAMAAIGSRRTVRTANFKRTRSPTPSVSIHCSNICWRCPADACNGGAAPSATPNTPVVQRCYETAQADARDPMHWTGSYYNWNSRCAECHSTNLSKRYDPNSGTYATTWSEINVGCEACHGPGARHMALADGAGCRTHPMPASTLTCEMRAHGISSPTRPSRDAARRPRNRGRSRPARVAMRGEHP